MAELPGGTVTFLFTDIEGSTRLVKALGREWESVLVDHQGILEKTFAAHGGRVVDTQGDSFFVVFARAGDAILAAAEGQRALSGHSWPDGAEVRVRMGLHSGEPRTTGERYTGFGVHRAARVGSAAYGGQILLSNATRELVQDELPAGTTLRDLGEYELKDLDRPERLFQVEAEELERDFSPLKAPRVAEPRPLLRRRLPILLTGLLLVAGIGTAALVARGGSGSTPTVLPNSLVKIDEGTGDIVDVVELGADPGQVDIAGDYVFVSGQDDGTLSRLDTPSGQVTKSGNFAATGSISADGDNSLWSVSTNPPEAVTNIDPQTLTPVGSVPLPRFHEIIQAFVEAGGGSLWVSQFSPPVVKRWRLPTLELVKTYRLTDDEFPLQVGFGGGAAWVALSVASALLRIDAADGETTEIQVGNVPRDPAYGFGSVWVAMGADGTVWRIDPRTNRTRAIIKVGKGPWGVAVGSESVWVTNHCDGTLSRIDPETDEVVETIQVGFFPQWLAVGHGHVWVGVAAAQGAQGLFLEECL